MHGYSGAHDTTFELILNAAILTVVLVCFGYAFLQRRAARRSQDGPVMSSDEMLNAKGLASLNRGEIAGFQYNLLTNDSGRVMFLVELGHNSWSHIVAYGDKSQVGGLIPKRWIEPADLEGDFPDYFHMYCNPESQDSLRELFTPDVMANFEDFCRSYDFELYRDTLYFSRAVGPADREDQTTLTTDVTSFLEKTGPVLKRLEP